MAYLRWAASRSELQLTLADGLVNVGLEELELSMWVVAPLVVGADAFERSQAAARHPQ